MKLAMKGFGLVEIMVAIALGLLLTTTMIKIVLNAKQNYALTESMTLMLENGRFALDLLGKDIRSAGFMGINNKVKNTLGVLSIGGSLGFSPTTDTCSTTDNSWGRMVNRPLYGLNDTNQTYACIPNSAYLRGDIIVSRHLASKPVGSNGIAATGNRYADSRLYFRTDSMEGKISLGRDLANIKNDILGRPTRDYALQSHAYYIRNTGRRCRGSEIPGLYRESLSVKGLPIGEEIASGIENIQFQYRIGSQYFDASNALDWSSVEAVQLWVLTRAECPELGFSDTQTYSLGDSTFTPDPAKPESAFRRRLFSTVISIRNQL